MSRRRVGLIALLVVLVAAGLRIWGCFGQGYPYSFYPDEQNNVVRAMQFGAKGSLDPDWFNKPALGYYVLFGEFGAYYMAGRAAGRFESSEDFALHYMENQGPFYLIGRLSTSLFGALTVLLTWFLGRRLCGREVGLLAAILLAAMVGHVQAGQQVKMDVPQTFFATWSALFIAGILRRGWRRDYLWAGFLAGLGIATKYVPVVMIVPFAFAHLFRLPRARDIAPAVWRSGRAWAGCAAFIAGFFVGSPYNFLNPKFGAWLGAQFRFVASRFGLASTLPQDGGRPRGATVDGEGRMLDSFEAMFASLGEAVGPLIAVLVVIGAIAAFRASNRRTALLLVTVGVLLLVLPVFNRQYSQPRHVNLLLPFLAVLGGLGFRQALRTSARVLDERVQRVLAWSAPLTLVVLVCLPVAGFPLRETVASNLERVAPDPRVRFLRWFESNVPAGATVINDFEKTPLLASQERCRWVLDTRLGFLLKRNQLDQARADGYRTLWKIRERIAGRAGRPGYDVIVFDHIWQAESLAKRLSAGASYNPTWPRSPWGWVMGHLLHRERLAGRLATVTAESIESRFREYLPEAQRALRPVEFWTRRSRVSADFLVGGRKPAAFLVTTKVTCENYRKPAKRANFPDFAAFYDDLAAHYDGLEFNGGDPDPARVIRFYDLRQRKAHGTLRRGAWDARLR